MRTFDLPGAQAGRFLAKVLGESSFALLREKHYAWFFSHFAMVHDFLASSQLDRSLVKAIVPRHPAGAWPAKIPYHPSK